MSQSETADPVADIGNENSHEEYVPYKPKILVPITTPEQLEMLTEKGKVWHWMKKEPLIPIGMCDHSAIQAILCNDFNRHDHDYWIFGIWSKQLCLCEEYIEKLDVCVLPPYFRRVFLSIL